MKKKINKRKEKKNQKEKKLKLEINILKYFLKNILR